MRLKPVFVALFAACLLGLGGSSTFAQTGASVPLIGDIVDTTGGAIPGVPVTLRIRGAAPRTTTTDAEGAFRFENVRAGEVTLSVAFDGFSPVETTLRHPQAGTEIVLKPRGVVEEVTVQAAGVRQLETRTATKTATPLRDVPQAVTVVTSAQIAEMSMQGISDIVRYMPGIGVASGEGNRDTPILRGNTSTADFFVDGVRDDVQYFRDVYNVERVEAIKGPNAMVFGRGGVGGVINRVTKQPDWRRVREASLQVGSWANRRFTADVGDSLGTGTAYRLTGLFEDSGSFRDGVTLQREGLNPTFAFSAGANTMIRVGYEYFHDMRTADRGVPSFNGRPFSTSPATFFGNADASVSEATVNAVGATVEHDFGFGVMLRSHTRAAHYDKIYQNVFPGALNAAGTTVSISGYNNGMVRTNAFNQTDLTWSHRAAGLTHRFVAGVEVGRQDTENLRKTAYFTSISPTTTTLNLPVSQPTTTLAMTFQPSATDANNQGVATMGAGYIQDQVRIGRYLEAVAGVRYDRFDVDFTNNRTAAQFRTADNLVSPRVGLIFKPSEPMSIYSSYSLSYMPRAGEQLSSLNLTNQALDPEVFSNYEVGAKWDVRPALEVSAALYRLDRSNVSVPSPLDPAQSILVDGQRTKGVELGVSGSITPAWSVLGGYAYQDARITRTQSASALAGASLAQVPEHSYSLWNRYDVTDRVGAGFGLIYRGDVFAATDNTVVLPALTRADAAVFIRFAGGLRGQINVENLFDTAYYWATNGNNNIAPGSPRAIRFGLTTQF
jgi:catecholate siderophore receptor